MFPINLNAHDGFAPSAEDHPEAITSQNWYNITIVISAGAAAQPVYIWVKVKIFPKK